MSNRRRPPPANLDGDPIESYVFRSYIRLGLYATLVTVTVVVVCVPAAWAWWFTWMVAVIGTAAWGEVDWQRYLKRRQDR
jgi:hypothetical protein